MTTGFATRAPRARYFEHEQYPTGAKCWGANHSDRGTIGTCSKCGADVVEVVKGERAWLAPMFHAGKYDARTYYCWNHHECDPERVTAHAAAKAARIAAGSVEKGATVVVFKGRKVPKGTTGVVIWTGEDNWGKGRCGVKDAEGTVHWTATANCRVVAAEPVETGPRCADCGEYGETTGHMECQYPKDH